MVQLNLTKRLFEKVFCDKICFYSRLWSISSL